jgi:hypothetical protein
MKDAAFEERRMKRRKTARESAEAAGKSALQIKRKGRA